MVLRALWESEGPGFRSKDREFRESHPTVLLVSYSLADLINCLFPESINLLNNLN